ncbi:MULTISPECIES: bifunctional oligoribonuclease/PAP phosphatase NrnA [unclassified Gemella]|uniref:DHH family phosphoesterase n=1 Tax=unclassified Gemella TaxID=2624949 RepID=UPI001073D206|nr:MULTISPECIES: bifunctional oligoribonuclease/PAP phosphatase NrnA [unclassified Gemella]MBF0710558.1 bifunctional oligoribonuclease/PAP phosphatase NrnA [Gemella sp. GL1.1]MBF0746273.1 bifunctional oligoribonuclease/PAP phosphatase NrnA [Gemella sp. 19428wG2_WT2a]NYS27902.1 bifunctional oligoribonuclease/PAP phosphatase NrnA [Gemella sp. GL1]TFU60551.1 bifunctional oligoribonuclease/PAP phosphatase NrnA [Gemella sp. WT2a]
MVEKNIELYEKIFQKIRQYKKIIIHRHERPDPDAYGSQGALAEIIRKNFEDKEVILVGKKSPSLSFLFDTVEVDSSDYKGALVITTDTANFDRIDGKLFTKENYLIKIDHHPPIDNYANINLVDIEVSSCSELIYNFYTYLKDKYNFKLTDKAAELIYVGIVGDTGRFLFPNTSANTLKVAAELLNYDFNMAQLLNRLDISSEKMMRFRSFIFKNYNVYHDGVVYLKITKADMEEYQIEPGEVSSEVNLIRSLEGLVAWCFAIDEGNKIRVRLRSKGPSINQIAEKYNGGGHRLASGATVKNWDELDDLLDDLARVVFEFNKNKEILGTE